MKPYLKGLIAVLCTIFSLSLTSCIEDDEPQFQCTPTVPVEADLIDSWAIEYRQYTQKVNETIIHSQNFTKQEGKFLNIRKDYTWYYTENQNGKDVQKRGTWKYEDGILYLNSAQEGREYLEQKIRVFRLCSLRLKADFNYQIVKDGVANDYSVIAILLRNK